MKMVLNRFQCGATCTIGELMVDGEHECWTLEDVVRPDGQKVMHETAIPDGTYPVTVTFSNRFQRDLPLLVGVPNFSGIRLHPGNSASDSSGCILPGTEHTADRVLNSRVAFNRLFPKIRDAVRRGEEVTITVSGGGV